MELTKKIITSRITFEDGADSSPRIKLTDITTTNNLISFGELRLDNADGSFDGKFQKDDNIEVELGLKIAETDTIRKIFTGIIESIVDDSLMILNLKGAGIKLFRKTTKASLFLTDNNAVFREILKGSDLPFVLEGLSTRALHSYIMRLAPVSEQLQRAIVFLDAGFVPWVNRDGTLILKNYENNIVATDVVFELDEVRKFENDIVETLLDTEIDIFNKIRVGGLDYVVTEHRFFLNEQRSKSFISVETA